MNRIASLLNIWAGLIFFACVAHAEMEIDAQLERIAEQSQASRATCATYDQRWPREFLTPGLVIDDPKAIASGGFSLVAKDAESARKILDYARQYPNSGGAIAAVARVYEGVTAERTFDPTLVFRIGGCTPTRFLDVYRTLMASARAGHFSKSERAELFRQFAKSAAVEMDRGATLLSLMVHLELARSFLKEGLWETSDLHHQWLTQLETRAAELKDRVRSLSLQWGDRGMAYPWKTFPPSRRKQAKEVTLLEIKGSVAIGRELQRLLEREGERLK